jgi:hypothetical protein
MKTLRFIRVSSDVIGRGERTTWVFFNQGIIVKCRWFEFEAVVTKLCCNPTDVVDLGWQDIRGLVEQRPIRVIAMLAKTQNGSSF